MSVAEKMGKGKGPSKLKNTICTMPLKKLKQNKITTKIIQSEQIDFNTMMQHFHLIYQHQMLIDKNEENSIVWTMMGVFAVVFRWVCFVGTFVEYYNEDNILICIHAFNKQQKTIQHCIAASTVESKKLCLWQNAYRVCFKNAVQKENGINLISGGVSYTANIDAMKKRIGFCSIPNNSWQAAYRLIVGTDYWFCADPILQVLKL